MIYPPEQLDNKPFRLFVQRTWHAMQNNLSLTPLEAQVARLISDHPEVGLFFPGREIDIAVSFPAGEHNPFLFLAALREVQQQLLQDKPAGIQQLYATLLGARISEAEARSRLASAYLEWHQAAKELPGSQGDEAYLLTLQDYLGDPNAFGDPFAFAVQGHADPNSGAYMGDVFDKAYAALRAQMYEEISSISLSPAMRLTDILERLPREWVQASAKYWRLPRRRLKRDNIRDLCHFFAKPEAAAALADALNDTERRCLEHLLGHDDRVDYDALAAQFGDERGDDYWWSKNPPTSTIGLLRLKGVLFVGREQGEGRRTKIALVPADLHALLRQAGKAE